MAEPKHKILIVEDDPDVAESLNAYFRVQGYEVFTVNWGEDGVRAGQIVSPDVILLDIRLPDIDGYEVARRLRVDNRSKDVPIIFLTERRERLDRLPGYENPADDYITKPFDVQELRLRVRNALKRVGQNTETNPVTGLPERSLVDERLSDIIHKSGWALLHISIIHLDAFREMYGFVASDDVFRAVSSMIYNTMKEVSNPTDFLGHISATDLVAILPKENMHPFQERIHSRLEQAIDYFYPIKDREKALQLPNRLSFYISESMDVFGHFSNVDELKKALINKSK